MDHETSKHQHFKQKYAISTYESKIDVGLLGALLSIILKAQCEEGIWVLLHFETMSFQLTTMN
jgi:hypothetical protein